MANQKFCGAVASQAYRWGYICEYLSINQVKWMRRTMPL